MYAQFAGGLGTLVSMGKWIFRTVFAVLVLGGLYWFVTSATSSEAPRLGNTVELPAAPQPIPGLAPTQTPTPQPSPPVTTTPKPSPSATSTPKPPAPQPTATKGAKPAPPPPAIDLDDDDDWDDDGDDDD